MSPTKALTDECLRQSENWAYTAVSFLISLRWLHGLKVVWLVAPAMAGAAATVKILIQDQPIWGAVLVLIATAVPPAYRISGLDKSIEQYLAQAGEFQILRDRFRIAATVSALGEFGAFEREAKQWMDRLDKLRARPLTPPEFCFWLAKRKIARGDYKHDRDLEVGSDETARA